MKSIGIEINNERFVLSIIRDITNRIKNDEKTRELASLVENTDDAIIGSLGYKFECAYDGKEALEQLK